MCSINTWLQLILSISRIVRSCAPQILENNPNLTRQAERASPLVALGADYELYRNHKGLFIITI